MLAAIVMMLAAAPADFTFEYTYPAPAARVAPLKAWLDADKARLRAAIATDAAEGRRDRAGSDVPFHPYDLSKDWAVVTDTPRFLSLSAQSYSFTGGAHGNTSSYGMLWDKTAGRRLEPLAVFASPDTLWAAIGRPYCAALQVELRARDGAALTDPKFWPCPRLKALTLLLGSRRGDRIDRLGLIADQYVAGPYVEGPYEVTLPVTPAVLRAVRPAYRAAFALPRPAP